MERNYLAVSVLAVIFLALVQVSVQLQVNYQQNLPPVLITNPLCGPGWERDPTEAKKCRAWCDNGCKNGYCKSPNTCECYPGFVKSLSGDCVEECPMSCLNGYCDVITNVCTCHTGYMPHESGKFCIPKCSLGCNYPQNCTAPETCSCPPDQISPFTRECESKCDPPCGNGRCVAHGKCMCADGYNLIEGTCQSVCNPPCQHGMCVAPNVCTCHKKWQLNQMTKFCEPICQGCENGECVAPDRCHCHPGYKKVAGKCVPHCSHCSSHSGKCVGPEKCECSSGYYSVDNGSSCKKNKNTAARIVSAIAHGHKEQSQPSQPVYYSGQQPPYYQDPNQQAVYNQPQMNQPPLYPVQQQNNYAQPQNQQPLYNPPVYVQSQNYTAG